MGIFEVLAIGLAFWGVTNSAVIKRACKSINKAGQPHHD
jgi:hypothetical protein